MSSVKYECKFKNKGIIRICDFCKKEFEIKTANHKYCQNCKKLVNDIKISKTFSRVKQIKMVKNRIAPDIYLVGYGRSQYYQICCLKCKDVFFPNDSNDPFCDSCSEWEDEQLKKYINPKKINAVYFADVIGWIQKTEANNKRSYYNFKKVFKRDGFTCQYCGFSPETSFEFRPLGIDHVIPFSFGGSNKMENLVVCCSACNSFANNKMFSSFENKKEFIIKGLGIRGKENGSTFKPGLN